MAAKRPGNLQEFFDFYYEDFKPLYNYLQSLNAPPIEMFFEVNAAFDHLSRYWEYHIKEKDSVDTACAHLKRGCFDAFKIIVRDTIDDYVTLQKLDTSIIDNGDFDARMHALIADIRLRANAARLAEGDSRDISQWHKAYELWGPVCVACAKFNKDFYLNSKVEWAKRKIKWRIWRNRLEGLIVGIIASSLVGILIWYLQTRCGQ